MLLYDIGIIDHIINDKKWFKDNYTFNKGQLKTLKTGGDPVIFKGGGTTVFTILSQINLPKFCEIVFENALYLPNIDVNLFNGLKHYKARGYLEKNQLYIPQRKTITILNIVKTSFFVFLKGQKSRNTFANFYYSSHKDDFYIPISARPLKAGPIRFNASERVIPKSGLHKPKDR